MSDKQKLFTLTYSYIFHWILLGIFYLLFTGIMQIINITFHFEQNQWLVGFIVLFIWTMHHNAKNMGKEVVKQLEEKSENK